MSTKTMYDGINGTEYTTLTANITNLDTTINVSDSSVFPSATNILVLYSVDSNGNVDTWERCKYTAIVDNSITISRTSDEHASSSSDSPLTFNSGDRVARMFTNWDYGTLKEHLEDTSSNLDTHTAASTAHGTTSAIVGESDTNTLTNKTIAGGTVTATNTITVRKDSAADWASSNPTLESGEIGLESDTGIVRIGDGSSTFTTLPRYLPDTFDVIGVRWEYGSSSPTLTSVNEHGDEVTTSSGQFNNHPIYSKMKRCDVSDNGEILAWYGDTTFDGSENGQVMVHIPKFWYKYQKTDTYMYWWISSAARAGFSVHPAFVIDVSGSTDISYNDYIFVSAFDGCAYDTSDEIYNAVDAAGVDFTASTGDKLSSIATIKPISGENNTLTRANARILAENRGTGWQLLDYNTLAAIQLLFIIENKTLNSQSVYAGITNLATGGGGNESVNTGYTAGYGTGSSDLGNTSGYVTIDVGGTDTYPFSYRGIENIYGNIWTWIDGINIKANYNPWICNIPNTFKDDIYYEPYTDTGLTQPAANNFISDIYDYPPYFITKTVAGSSSTYFCDKYYQSSGNRVSQYGGAWDDATNCGIFALIFDQASSGSSSRYSARLLYRPGMV